MSKKMKSTKSESAESRLLSWSDLVSALAVVCLLVCYRDYDRAVRDLLDARQELNVTKNCRGDILVFNRVPKVGSVTMKYLVGVLREQNDFKAFSSLDMMPVQVFILHNMLY